MNLNNILTEFEEEFKDWEDMIFGKTLEEGGGHPNFIKKRVKAFLSKKLTEVVSAIPCEERFANGRMGFSSGYNQHCSEIEQFKKDFLQK